MIDWLPPCSLMHLFPVYSHTPAGWRQAALWDSEPSSFHPARSRWEVLGKSSTACKHFLYIHTGEKCPPKLCRELSIIFGLQSIVTPMMISIWAPPFLELERCLIWALANWAAGWDGYLGWGEMKGWVFHSATDGDCLGRKIMFLRSMKPPGLWHRKSTVSLGAKVGIKDRSCKQTAEDDTGLQLGPS